MYQRNTADDCKATNKRQPRNAVTVLVSFYSRAGDCFEMMSAHLSQPIISTASPVRAAETATWAETVCDSACMCVDVSARVCVCGGDGNKSALAGLHKDRVAVRKNPHWEHLHKHTQIKSKGILLRHADSE